MINILKIYEYWITLPVTPAFQDNIDAAIAMIAMDGGASPTVKAGIELGRFDYIPAIGTKADSGKHLLHMQLRERYTETELIAYFESAMTGAKPPITVEFIESTFPIIPVVIGQDDDGNDIIEMQRETIKTFDKSAMLKYIPDIVTNNPDGSEASRRPVNMTDDIFMSGYANSDNYVVEL